MPRRENKVTPKVIGLWLYHEGKAIRLDSAEWYAWLQSGRTFYVETPDGTFTARAERRGHYGGTFWYAFRMAGKRQHKAYLGKSEDVSSARLVEIARQLDEKVRV